MIPSQILTIPQRDDFVERLAARRREEQEMAAHTLRAMGYDPVAFLIAELHAVPPVSPWKFSADLAARQVGRALRGLANCEDLRVIGPLCERMQEADEDAQWRAQLSLKTLLPRLRSADFDLLNPAQKTRLYGLLHSHDALLCVAALQAIAQIGESRALPQVEALIHSPNLDIWQAAVAALPSLQERARRELEGRTLLRGASAPVMGGDTLLRPAPPVHAARPEEMLRAVGAEHTPTFDLSEFDPPDSESKI